MALTEGEILRAQRLVASGGFYYAAVGRKLGRSRDAIRRALKSRIKPRGHQAQHVAVHDDGRAVGMRAAGFPVDPHRMSVPAEVLAERERAENCARTLTAALLGDPPAGRSALDKRAAE